MQNTAIDAFGDTTESRLKSSFGKVAEDVKDLASDVKHTAKERGDEAMRAVREKTHDAEEKLSAIYHDGRDVLRDRVTAKPLASIGIAMLAGAVLSSLLFRR